MTDSGTSPMTTLTPRRDDVRMALATVTRTARRIVALPIGCLTWIGIGLIIGLFALTQGPREFAVSPLLTIGLYVLWTWHRSRRRHRSEVAQLSTPTKAALYALTPYDFERLVEQILVGSGWGYVRHVGGPGDNGADLYGYDGHHPPRRCVVQCKRLGPGASVGSQTIQVTLGAMAIYNAARAIVFTTGGYTDQARELAERMEVCLYDGDDVAQMAEALGIEVGRVAA